MYSDSNSPTYDIYGIGAALVDTEIEVTNAHLQQLDINKGVMTLVDEARQHQLVEALKDRLVTSHRASGGSAANSIIAASYFGNTTFYSCRVANDDNGQFYLHDLTEAGVHFHANNGNHEGITGKCLVMITDDAERTMNTFLGISETLDISDIDEQALAQSRYAYIEGYLVSSDSGRPAAIKLRQLAEQHGVKTALSLSDPAIVNFFHDGLTDMIGNGVDLLFCNKDEALTYTKTDDLEQAFEQLKHIAKTFVITLGAEGALMFNGTERIHVNAPKVKALDSNGAGDMFAGAFMATLNRGGSFQQAGEFACKAAAQVVSQFGPRLQPAQYQALREHM